MKLATVKFLNLEILKLNNEGCSRRFYVSKILQSERGSLFRFRISMIKIEL